jgi:hypothetical protein
MPPSTDLTDEEIFKRFGLAYNTLSTAEDGFMPLKDSINQERPGLSESVSAATGIRLIDYPSRDNKD